MEELAQVYGRSLFDVARENDKLELMREQLGTFVDAVNEHRDLQVFFFSPYFSTREKSDALGRILIDADQLLVNFLALLIENHRMPVIFRIRRVFEKLWEAENRMLAVEITSAIELDEQTTRALSERISQRTKHKVALTARVEPNILGGIVLRIGNSILDASIRSRLEQLRRQVSGGAAV